MARILGSGASSLPVKYFGLPLGAFYKAKYIWDGVIKKMRHRLASWKIMYLSKGGRVTLIKSTIDNLPTYYMSLFPLPASVANHMEKIQYDFLWGGLGEEFKYHLMSWSKVCFPIFKERLGIMDLMVFNRALLGKWLWRSGPEREAWWRLAVDSKYDSLWVRWCSLVPAGAFGVGL